MPFDQLRSLVVSLTEPDREPGEQPRDATRGAVYGPALPVQTGRKRPLLIDDPASEFDSRGTTCRGPRTSTLDQLIAFLRKQ